MPHYPSSAILITSIDDGLHAFPDGMELVITCDLLDRAFAFILENCAEAHHFENDALVEKAVHQCVQRQCRPVFYQRLAIHGAPTHEAIVVGGQRRVTYYYP